MHDLRRLRTSDYRVMPWKNGLGTTTELAIDPAGASLDDFTWRVSIADLTVSGPFSAFPGCDRIIAQLDGPPMTLSHGRAGELRLAQHVPYRFAGELATHATLDGPARDFNVIVRRDRAAATLVARAVGPSTGEPIESGAATLVVHMLAGFAGAGGDPWVEVFTGETLVVPPETRFTLLAGREGAVMLVASIGPAPGGGLGGGSGGS